MKDPLTRRLILALALLWLLIGVSDVAVLCGGVGTGPIAVLIVEETSERDKLTPGQRDAILSNADDGLRAYCKTHCEKDAAGAPEFRVVDKDDSLAKESPLMQELFTAKRDSVPWIVIKRGAAVVSQAFPKTEAEILALVKRYGG